MPSGFEAMLTLGPYRFAVDSTAYDEFTRAAGYAWAEQPRIGGRPALQFTGVESETITLRGRVYPAFLASLQSNANANAFLSGLRRARQYAMYRGPLTHTNFLRALASEGEPLLLTSGGGDNLGFWVVERVNEVQNTFFANGVPRKIEFDLSLKRYA